MDDLKLEFEAGLSVFTGETGAGKSILVEALGFVLGERASAEQLRAGSDRMEVSAVFELPESGRVLMSGLEISGRSFAMRRELDSKGRGKAFLDSRAVPVSTLAALGERLVDFHGQHDHQTLLKPSVHLQFLDSFGKLEKETERVGKLFRERRALISKLESTRLSKEEKDRLLDLYRYQLKEIEDSSPRAGEDAELEARLPRVKNAEKLRSLAEEAYALLYSEEGSVVEKISRAARIADELSLMDSSISDAAGLLKQAQIAAEEASGGISAYKEGITSAPGEVDALLSRLDRLSSLKKKYGPGIENVIETGEVLKGKIADLESSDEKEQDLEAALAEAGKELAGLCSRLHDKRTEAAKKLASLVLKEIRPLGFPEIRFSVSVEMEEDRFTETGADTVEFLFSANPGQPVRPLKSIASGGEMSRVMLGLKTVLACSDRIPVLVFDEVDAGVGGVVGRLVGEKLSWLSSKRQVLCVTHLPQVAGFAASHFNVRKETGGKTSSVCLRRLEGRDRVEEIARMLGGKKQSSELGIRHAEELLGECGKGR